MMMAKSLDEGLSKVILLDTTEVAFEENNGKLVYASGPISTEKVSFLFCFKTLFLLFIYLDYLMCIL